MSDNDFKVGVYICHCGVNISAKVDINRVIEFARTLPNVSVSREYKFMCSDPGQELIQQDIRDGLVNRVIVASCSPLMHEGTFRTALSNAGLNAFLFHMVNIREHVSWVTADPEKATIKAQALVAAGVLRVVRQQPLERQKVSVNPNVLVVGGGIAGIHAALTMASSGKKVYLVERSPSIGGHMSLFDKTFPTLDCAACILTPKMVSVNQSPNIDLMTWSEVSKVGGYVGNFKVTVKKKPRYVDLEKCISCGLCYEACLSRPSPNNRRLIIGKQVVKEGWGLQAMSSVSSSVAASVTGQPKGDHV